MVLNLRLGVEISLGKTMAASWWVLHLTLGDMVAMAAMTLLGAVAQRIVTTGNAANTNVENFNSHRISLFLRGYESSPIAYLTKGYFHYNYILTTIPLFTFLHF